MADLVLINANVLTMNPAQPHAEAVAIVKDRIVRVCKTDEVSSLIEENTKILDLQRKTIIPGFIDTHIHVADFGRTLAWLDLKEVDSIKKLQDIVEKRAKETLKDRWILGSGWNQENFVEKRRPTLQELDAVAPDNPIILYHQLGRACITNSKALRLSGITKTTYIQNDGVIEKDSETGELTGILEGSATDLVWNCIPAPTEEETVEAAKEACRKIVEAGITSIHWIALSDTEASIAQKLIQGDEVMPRVFLIVTSEIFENLSSDKTNMNINGVLVFLDGYLASQTAALKQPYVGNAANNGKMYYTQEEMNQLVAKIREADLQIVIHAMGDKAIDVALKALQSITKTGNYPNRLEQAALLNRRLIESIRRTKPIVSIQPKVIESEFNMWSAIEHLGEGRARMLFPLKALIKNGVCIIAGSDCPMEPLSPMLGIQSLVMRKPFSEERLSVEEALRLYSLNAAVATEEEKEKGSIEEGKLADLTVLSQNPMTIASDELANIMIEMTVIGGRILYQKLS